MVPADTVFVPKSAENDSLDNPARPQSQTIDPSAQQLSLEMPLASSSENFGYLVASSPPPLPTSMSYTPGTHFQPFLRNRSISSPTLEPQQGRAGSKRVASGAIEIHTSRSRRDHQWSVFGQLMENEGQMPTPRVRSERRLSSQSRHGGTPTSAFTQTPLLEENLHQFPFAEPATLDDGYDSESSDISTASESHPFPPAGSSKSSSWVFPRNFPTIPISYRNMLKCAIAYFIASLFTFSPYLSHLIGSVSSYGAGPHEPSPSGHMVATIAVYFNPAKTMGAMLEADLFCFLGLLYSAFVCLASMSMFWWLELKPGWEWLGDAIAILWIGVSMSIVAWMKVWMASPSFNTACSMTAIIVFVVLVKEGGLETLLQVSTIVLCGSVISNLVCYLIWPQSATANLQTSMTKSLDSFATLLSMLTNVFLLENENDSRSTSLEKIQRAAENHQSSFTSLKKDLSEAKSEWLQSGRSIEDTLGGLSSKPASKGGFTMANSYEDAVDSLNRLAQHLNGLRSGTRLQHDLTKAGVFRRKNNHRGKSKMADVDDSTPEDEETLMLKAAAVMFGDLVDELGPPLSALSAACTGTLKRLREAFIQSQTHKRERDMIQPHEFMELVDGIEKALVRFDSTSNHAVLRLYRKSHPHPHSLASSISSMDPQKDMENSTLLQGDNEHVFLVYFFIFTLQEFAGELITLVDAMGKIYIHEKVSSNRQPLWARFFSTTLRNISSLATRTQTPSRKHPGLKRRFSAYMIPEHRRPHPSFPKIRPHAPDTMQTPSRRQLSFLGKLKQSMWAIGKRLKEGDAKYAIKAGMATAILASPAFFDATRPTFVKYWGDWALISYFIVISPTIGATNYLSLHRVVGTLFGAAVAAGVYSLFPENAYVLSIFGFFFSLPCFYYAITKPQYLSGSRFVLLTYNLTCLYCYNIRQKEVFVMDIAFHRALAVTVGVLWAAIISRFWWPAEARRELSKALGDFCLNIGWLYTRLVASNSFAPEYHPEEAHHEQTDEREPFIAKRAEITKLNDSIREFMAMELHLQIKLIELQGLLAQTQNEPRLKGPFPVQLYRGVLTSLQTILDKLHSMRCVTTREEWYTSVRKDFIIPVNKERREMVGNIILSFSTLASAFRLKAPLPPYLPPAEKSRQNLVDAIRRLDIVRRRDVKGSRQLLFFAYALTMKGVTQELESLGHVLQEAFGVIGQTPEEFEALFLSSEDSERTISSMSY